MIVGALIIDWEKRSYELHGMDGNGKDMTATEVANLIETPEPNKEKLGLIWWEDADQLAAWDVERFKIHTQEVLEEEKDIADYEAQQEDLGKHAPFNLNG